jgi:hypothetical protein
MSHKYCAVIIEPRRHRALEFVLRNARECLSADWKIILFHGSNNGAYAQEIVDRVDKQILLVNLNVDNLNQITYSRLLATKSAVYDHIDRDMFLVFQTDSMIFKQHAHFMEDFLQYDYVGSPWLVTAYPPTKRCDFIGNGGFSLRRKSKMLEIMEKIPYNDEYEDLYFSMRYDAVQVHKPPYEVARRFSVDETFTEITMACHQPWSTPHWPKFKELYPECEQLRSLQGTA